MKQQTKESIEWIKSTLNDWIKNKYYPLGKEDRLYEQERDSKDITNAINFLDSLPELEEQLKHGGFIPDINKTPCKDGDRVHVLKHPDISCPKIMYLIWDSDCCFVLGDKPEPDNTWYLRFDSCKFVKVE